MKVLFFDSWKGGRKKYIRLLSELERLGIDSLLVHLGSWGNETEFEKEEFDQRLMMRDISYYGTLDFEKVLTAEKPDLVFFLSTHTFAHRAMIRYCRKLNIPTINQYHGFVTVQDTKSNDGPYKVSYSAYFKFAFGRLPKFVTKTIPCYLKSLRKTNASLYDYGTFIKHLVQMFTRPSAMKIADDAKTSRFLVYADADKAHAVETYAVEKQNVYSVGNPDINDFGLNSELIGSQSKIDTEYRDNVIYIDTALTATGLIFKSQSQYLSFLKTIKSHLESMGKAFYIKPHPETLRLYGKEELQRHGLKVIPNEEFMTRLQETSLVMTEPSTLSIIPALVGLPLALVAFGDAEELKYGDVLKSYPRGFILHRLVQLQSNLSHVGQVDSEAISEWIEFNGGPQPAEQMPRRVVSHILELIKQNN
ncbi:hypothetical protein OB69_03115 [Roseivirga seohaensis subsp. aquiponti]|uniref:UDP-glycosyltransferase n=1 Tax=Roseivirga seohaensis subsp. aquiponti TaxID=1566026 RepID=A0A0L8ANU2_9BACT|nr:hypothetical protein [Roseivirga seohaensis]KOF04009.1 hypothetical protein OB69_03115 [Roseivirga seohaensis subsp. aquiponti]